VQVRRGSQRVLNTDSASRSPPVVAGVEHLLAARWSAGRAGV